MSLEAPTHHQRGSSPAASGPPHSQHLSSRLDEESPTIEQPVSSQNHQMKHRRKGHRKSRRGCFSCKKARMKCDEIRPTCDYCFHRGFRCEWPEIQAREVCRPTETTSIENIFQSATPVFTMQDFRLFSHFIESAYPKRPFHNDSIWTHEIPSISSDYDYLLHSMLALSASDIARSQPPSSPLAYTALAYRLKAVTSLKTTMSLGIQSFEQGNAMLATCYNLFVQSTLIEDGVIEYMTFIRGWTVVGLQMLAQEMKFLFHSMWGDENVATISPSLELAPLIDAQRVKAACASLERLQHLCVRSVEIEMFGLLLGTARALFTSSHDAFMTLRKIYGLFSRGMSHEAFRDFTDSTNEVGRLLQSHFVALHLIMAPISKVILGEEASTWAEYRKNGTRTCWLSSMHANIPQHMLMYYEWPVSIQNEFQGGLVGWTRTNNSDE